MHLGLMFCLPALPCPALPHSGCSRVMCEGRVEEAATWLRQLEEDAGVAPVWEVLFQAMCCPVPQVRRLWGHACLPARV